MKSHDLKLKSELLSRGLLKADQAQRANEEALKHKTSFRDAVLKLGLLSEEAVLAIEADLMKQMSDAGLKRMQSLNNHVDASKHEILTAGPGPIDTVIEVFEEGYELNGKVLRPAKVKVGDGA